MTIINDSIWDRKLGIRTCGRDYSELDAHNFGYDPTPYYCLERLAGCGIVSSADTFVDYGCGMGRACFAINHLTGASAVGVDFNPRFIDIANSNLAKYGSSGISFVLSDAREYIPSAGSVFYFYNPFSVDIQLKVLENIRTYAGEGSRLIFLQPDRHVEDALREEDLTLLNKLDMRPLVRSKDNHMFMYIYST